MSNNLNLFKYYKEDEFNLFVTEKINSILKNVDKKSNILFLGKIDLKNLKNKNLNIKSFCFSKDNYEKEIDDFFSFSKKNKLNFDYIFDISFMQYIKMSFLSKYMQILSNLSKYKTKYYLISLSNDSNYCKINCPKRLWTIKDKKYVRYFKKNHIKRTVEKKFKIIKINLLYFSIDEDKYFEISGIMTNKRLS
ncbi:MAG: hypothetical protein ACLFPJ_01140 [Candidatus Woesearchaeota archaeon]